VEIKLDFIILPQKKKLATEDSISLICDNGVTTQNLWFFRRNFKGFWSTI